MTVSNEAAFFLADMSPADLLVSEREMIEHWVSQGVQPGNPLPFQGRIKTIEGKITICKWYMRWTVRIKP